MIANLTRGAKTASLHLPADRFQIAGVLSYLGVDRLDDYELPGVGQDSSGIMVSLEPTGIAERNIAELCRNEKISLGRLNSCFRSLFKLPYADRDTLMRLVYEKYASKQKKDEDEIPPSSISVEQVLSEQNQPPNGKPHDVPEGAKLHNAPRPEELS